VKTQFRPQHQWSRWRPHQGALLTFLDLAGTTFVESSRFSVILTRPERIDTAEDVGEARRLLESDDALASATGIDFMVIGESGSLDSMTFWWRDTSAAVTVAGSDDLVANALRDRAAGILEAGTVGPEEPMALVPGPRLVERETKLPLAVVRFVGTYAAVHRLIDDMADQVRQARGSLDFVYVALTEPGTTLTVRHLGQLGEITGRDVHRLRHLTISLGSSADGPSLSLYITARRVLRGMSGSVVGPDEAPVRALRAAANDLLRDRGSFPGWVMWAMTGGGMVVEAAGFGLLLLGDVRPLGWALVGMAFLLFAHPLYLPPIELLNDGDKTRWSRSSRYIIGLVIAWLVASLAVPFFTH
jgi:hypothetical protein